MKKAGSSEALPASGLIDRRIAELQDWRGETLARMRALDAWRAAFDTLAERKVVGKTIIRPDL